MLTLVLLSLLVLLGHTGWWLFCYNRVNASALPRRLIKSLELLFLFCIVAIPAWFVGTQWQALQAVVQSDPQPTLSPLMLIWVGASLLSLVVLGPMWLESRLWLWPPRNLLHVQDQRVRVSQHVSQPLTATWLARVSEQLPLNEITCLSITRKTLQLERALPKRGLTIGHISDVHFTGQLTPAFYHYVMDQFQSLQPDLMVLSGDIVDEDACISWLEPILGKLQAPLGRYFVLGNHERRLRRPEIVAEQLSGLGWKDLGASDFTIADAANEQPMLWLCGNERPWFERHEGVFWQAADPESTRGPADVLRIGVAHTPDQHTWARDLGLDLLLAGHTHGGQIRIPAVGPIIAPSRYGSRFASGVFRLPPTVMHVSRGLAGVHPWRWRCMPEVSLLTIQSR